MNRHPEAMVEGPLAEAMAHDLRGDPPAAGPDEQGRLPGQGHLIPYRQPARQRHQGRPAHRHAAGLAPLAGHRHEAAGGIKALRHRQTHQFSHPQA